MKKALFVFLAICCMFSSVLYAREINIPHLTGGSPEWQDFITIDNMADKVDYCKLILYRNSSRSHEQNFSIMPYKSLIIDIKALDFYADCGVILFDDDVNLSCFRCRLSYKHINGGVAEFELDNLNKSQLSFNFSNNFTDLVQWKGIAVMNSSFSPQDVTLYALGNGEILGINYDTIGPRSKIVGFHSAWFPNLDVNNIESIVITSLNAPLTGVTISGNHECSKLLFTPAKPVTSFKDLNNQDLQLAKRLIGSWTFLEYSENFAYEIGFIFTKIARYDAINDEFEISTFPVYAITENAETFYESTPNYFSLKYEYQNSYGKFSKVYNFTFIDDYRIQGSVYVYDNLGEMQATGSLLGTCTGKVYNNNANEDLSFD